MHGLSLQNKELGTMVPILFSMRLCYLKISREVSKTVRTQKSTSYLYKVFDLQLFLNYTIFFMKMFEQVWKIVLCHKWIIFLRNKNLLLDEDVDYIWVCFVVLRDQLTNIQWNSLSYQLQYINNHDEVMSTL